MRDQAKTDHSLNFKFSIRVPIFTSAVLLNLLNDEMRFVIVVVLRQFSPYVFYICLNYGFWLVPKTESKTENQKLKNRRVLVLVFPKTEIFGSVSVLPQNRTKPNRAHPQFSFWSQLPIVLTMLVVGVSIGRVGRVRVKNTKPDQISDMEIKTRILGFGLLQLRVGRVSG